MSFTISILDVVEVPSSNGTATARAAQVKITDSIDTYTLNIGGLPIGGDLQTILDNNAAQVWAEASGRGELKDILDSVSVRQLFKGLIELLVQEINKLRVNDGDIPYTRQQVIDVLQAKLEELAQQ